LPGLPTAVAAGHQCGAQSGVSGGLATGRSLCSDGSGAMTRTLSFEAVGSIIGGGLFFLIFARKRIDQLRDGRARTSPDLGFC
jgi:hypothetical protein